jgi:hypothetical protein
MHHSILRFPFKRNSLREKKRLYFDMLLLTMIMIKMFLFCLCLIFFSSHFKIRQLSTCNSLLPVVCVSDSYLCEHMFIDLHINIYCLAPPRYFKLVLFFMSKNKMNMPLSKASEYVCFQQNDY